MKNLNKLTVWAFWIGAIISVLYGLNAAMSASFMGAWVQPLLVVLGIIVGLVNITRKEVTGFLLSVLSLAVLGQIIGVLSDIPYMSKLGVLLVGAVSVFTYFLGAAAVIVALKEAWALAAKK